MKLGIDLDGVCYDFVSALKNYAVNREGFAPGELPYATCWDFFKNQWGWTTEQYLDVFGRGVLAGDIFWRGDPEPHCRAALAALQADGHYIAIVTHRAHPDPEVAYQMKRATIEWLRHWDITYDALYFEGTKTGLSLDILIDDAPHTIEAAQLADECVVAFDRPWNRHCVSERVYSWRDLLTYVRREAKEVTSA